MGGEDWILRWGPDIDKGFVMDEGFPRENKLNMSICGPMGILHVNRQTYKMIDRKT